MSDLEILGQRELIVHWRSMAGPGRRESQHRPTKLKLPASRCGVLGEAVAQRKAAQRAADTPEIS